MHNANRMENSKHITHNVQAEAKQVWLRAISCFYHTSSPSLFANVRVSFPARFSIGWPQLHAWNGAHWLRSPANWKIDDLSDKGPWGSCPANMQVVSTRMCPVLQSILSLAVKHGAWHCHVEELIRVASFFLILIQRILDLLCLDSVYLPQFWLPHQMQINFLIYLEC